MDITIKNLPDDIDMSKFIRIMDKALASMDISISPVMYDTGDEVF